MDPVLFAQYLQHAGAGVQLLTNLSQAGGRKRGPAKGGSSDEDSDAGSGSEGSEGEAADPGAQGGVAKKRKLDNVTWESLRTVSLGALEPPRLPGCATFGGGGGEVAPGTSAPHANRD